MVKKRKQQAQDFFEKYKDNQEAMMIFMEHLKQEEHIEFNTKRLKHLSMFDNSYARFPKADVFSGQLGQT